LKHIEKVFKKYLGELPYAGRYPTRGEVLEMWKHTKSLTQIAKHFDMNPESVRHVLAKCDVYTKRVYTYGEYNHSSKPIHQIDNITGLVVKTYSSKADAEEIMCGNRKATRIYKAMTKGRLAYGYKWSYAESSDGDR